VGLEIVEQLAERDARPGPLTVLVPIGGGGLSAGICVAVKSLRPDAKVIGVEPELAADAAESIAADRVVRWDPGLTGRTIADGVRTSALGSIPFALLRCHLERVVTVSEDDIKRAMLQAASQARIVAEPSGAIAIAALPELAADLPVDGDTVAVVSGGNVDPATYRSILAEAAAMAPPATRPEPKPVR
jgi:threonine dehydratase